MATDYFELLIFRECNKIGPGYDFDMVSGANCCRVHPFLFFFLGGLGGQ